MNTFCDDFHGCPQLEPVGREGEGERERQPKLWMFCTDGKDGGLQIPTQDLLRGMSL